LKISSHGINKALNGFLEKLFPHEAFWRGKKQVSKPSFLLFLSKSERRVLMT